MSTATLTLPPRHHATPPTNQQNSRSMTPSVPAVFRLLTSGAVEAVERIARRTAFPVLRGGLALIMIWFGAPKLIPGGSPAEAIAVDTVSLLTGGLIAGDIARLLLGVLEVGLGIVILVPAMRQLALIAMLGHMAATFTPLFLFPALTWHGPFVGSLEGQYILKNILVVGVILVLLGFSRPSQAQH